LRQHPNGPQFPFIDTEEFPAADGVVRYAVKVGPAAGTLLNSQKRERRASMVGGQIRVDAGHGAGRSKDDNLKEMRPNPLLAGEEKCSASRGK
jgi:hypothetical protein